MTSRQRGFVTGARAMAGVRISVGAVSAVEARVNAAVQPAVEAA